MPGKVASCDKVTGSDLSCICRNSDVNSRQSFSVICKNTRLVDQSNLATALASEIRSELCSATPQLDLSKIENRFVAKSEVFLSILPIALSKPGTMSLRQS